MKSISPEVVEIIFSKLSKKDMLRCASTSRQFRDEAQRRLFYSVDFAFAVIQSRILGSKARKLVHILSQSARLRALVQILKLSIGRRDLDRVRSVQSALPLPKLRIFILSNSFLSAADSADVLPWTNTIYTLLNHTSLQSVYFTGNVYSWYSTIRLDLAPFKYSTGSTATRESMPSSLSFCTLVAEACAYHYTGRIRNLFIETNRCPLFWDIYTVNLLLAAGVLNIFKFFTQHRIHPHFFHCMFEIHDVKQGA